ncbi:MAG: YaiI/YqxD family protein [Oscillospiraceae bacterium]|nr:YaiI/YqxD family protein [Oscillospiraceae bacterium]
MRILIDADGCPVVDIAVGAARRHSTPCVILCDTSHEFKKEGATTITVSRGADSVDFALVNLLSAGDIVVTQDYGLAAMCLARRAVVVNQDGMIYDESNIEALLLQRHTAAKIRRGGGRLRGNSKRKEEQNKAFAMRLEELLEGKSDE